MAVKYYILRIHMFTTYKLAVKYYKFVCFQLSEFYTMNSYVTNQKKLAIEITRCAWAGGTPGRILSEVLILGFGEFLFIPK
jgi:hypothetical protein